MFILFFVIMFIYFSYYFLYVLFIGDTRYDTQQIELENDTQYDRRFNNISRVQLSSFLITQPKFWRLQLVAMIQLEKVLMVFVVQLKVCRTRIITWRHYQSGENVEDKITAQEAFCHDRLGHVETTQEVLTSRHVKTLWEVLSWICVEKQLLHILASSFENIHFALRQDHMENIHFMLGDLRGEYELSRHYNKCRYLLSRGWRCSFLAPHRDLQERSPAFLLIPTQKLRNP